MYTLKKYKKSNIKRKVKKKILHRRTLISYNLKIKVKIFLNFICSKIENYLHFALKKIINIQRVPILSTFLCIKT